MAFDFDKERAVREVTAAMCVGGLKSIIDQGLVNPDYPETIAMLRGWVREWEESMDRSNEAHRIHMEELDNELAKSRLEVSQSGEPRDESVVSPPPA